MVCDYHAWTPESRGIFSIISFFNELSSSNFQKDDATCIWSLRASTKGFALCRRMHWNIDNKSLRSSSAEGVNHLFIHCNFAYRVRMSSLQRFHLLGYA